MRKPFRNYKIIDVAYAATRAASKTMQNIHEARQYKENFSAGRVQDRVFDAATIVALYTGEGGRCAKDPDAVWGLGTHLSNGNFDLFSKKDMAAVKAALEKQFPVLKEASLADLKSLDSVEQKLEQNGLIHVDRCTAKISGVRAFARNTLSNLNALRRNRQAHAL